MDEGQDEAPTGKRHDSSKPKNGQETMNHLHTCIYAYMHTCIHAYIKLTFSFQEIKQGRPPRNGARYKVYCDNQELKPPRHEASRVEDRDKGASPA